MVKAAQKTDEDAVKISRRLSEVLDIRSGVQLQV
jgi:hypothetical protein